jgi:glycosyltransferase involved in cell wall biosynthesis
VPEKNTETAADMLKQLAQQPDRLKTLGENGLQIVKNKFSEENFVNTFRNLAEGLK